MFSFYARHLTTVRNVKSIDLASSKVPKCKYAPPLPPQHHMSVYFTEYLIPGIYHLKILGIVAVKIPGILGLEILGISTPKIPGLFTS